MKNTVYALALDHLTIEPPLWAPERWGNTSVTVIDKAEPWKVEVLNCTAHLDEAAPDDAASKSGF